MAGSANCLYLVRYEILSVSDSRDAYDRFGLDSLKGGGGPGMDPADLFSELFGGMNFGFDFGGPGGGPRRPKGEDSVIHYDVTLEDLYNGKSVKMNMEKEAVCTVCKGSVGVLAEHRAALTTLADPAHVGQLSQSNAPSARAEDSTLFRHM